MKSIMSFGGGEYIGGVERYIERMQAAMLEYFSIDIDITKSNSAIFKSRRKVLSLLRIIFSLSRFIWRSASSSENVVIVHIGNGVDVYLLWVIRKFSNKRLVVICHFGDKWRFVSSRYTMKTFRKISKQKNINVYALNDWHRMFLSGLGLDIEPILAPTFLAGSDKDVMPFINREKSLSLGQELNICYVGRVTEEKGLDYLPDILSSITRLQPQVKLTFRLCGGGEEVYVEKIVSSIKRLNIDVINLGFVNDSKVREVLSESDMLLYTSDVDAFPLSLLESIILGIPYIARSSPAIDEVHRRFGGGAVILDMTNENKESYVNFFENNFYLAKNREKLMPKFNAFKLAEIISGASPTNMADDILTKESRSLDRGNSNEKYK